MTQGLHRYFGAQHLHFITGSCYQRAPLLRTAHRRDLVLAILEQARRRYRFEQWRWSSYRRCAYGEAGNVKINQWPRIELKVKPAA